jgi:hypothetical protein
LWVKERIKKEVQMYDKNRKVELGNGQKVSWDSWVKKMERFNELKLKLFKPDSIVQLERKGPVGKEWGEYNSLCLLVGPVLFRIRENDRLKLNSVPVGV